MQYLFRAFVDDVFNLTAWKNDAETLRYRDANSDEATLFLHLGTANYDVTIWLLMSKLDEQNVQGGETALLHLDDWEHCEDLFRDPVGKQNFLWGSPKSKNIEYKVAHPIFTEDQKKRPQI